MAEEKVTTNTHVYDDAALAAEYAEKRRGQNQEDLRSLLILKRSWKSGICASASP